MNRILKSILVLAVLSVPVPIPAAAAETRPPVDTVVDALDRVREFREVAVSADGRRVAWVEKRRDAEGRPSLSAVFLAERGEKVPRRLTASRDGRDHRERSPAFSPDARNVAFLSDAGRPGQIQVWIAPSAGGPARAITRVAGQLDHLRWSADGRSVAFLFVEGSAQETGALVPYKPHSGVVEETVEEQRIAIADARTGRVRTVSPANLYVYDYDWSADGTRFVAEAAEGSGTDNYWIAQLYLVGAVSGAARALWKPPLQIANPRFSPDGKTVAVIHGLMSDEGSTGGDVWLVPAEGGEPRNATPQMRASARALDWNGGGEVLAVLHEDGEMAVAALDAATGRTEKLWKAAEAIPQVAFAGAGRLSAVVKESFLSPPEVWAGPVGSWQQVSYVNSRARPFWGEAKSLHWQSDGETVQGWLLYPAGFDPARRYPLAVSVHGGPSSAASPVWPSRWNAVLPSQGYFVFLPNPRGSYGFGEKFTQGNVQDFGLGDLRDIDRGVDAVIKAAPVDPHRLGILGWSYGGYMAMWAVTQTNRFAAAVAGAGIVDWRSYYGQNRIDRWMLPFFGASVYDDPAVYAKSSPIEFIRKVKTPTLVLHGDRDSEVPTPQGYEFWHALKTLGVATQLAIYENEGHSVSLPGHVRDIERRVVEWFDKYLAGGGRP